MDDFISTALWTTALISGGMLAVASVVGLLVGLLQTIFSVQEQSLSYSIKLAVVGGSLAIASPWIGSELINLMQQCFFEIALLGGRH